MTDSSFEGANEPFLLTIIMKSLKFVQSSQTKEQGAFKQKSPPSFFFTFQSTPFTFALTGQKCALHK